MKNLALFCGFFALPLRLLCADPSEPLVRAQLTARNSAVLAAEVGARIRQLHVVEGGSFDKGDLLISFDDALQQSQVARAEAVLTAAQRALAVNQRLHRLNSVGQVELDFAELEAAKAQAELTYARAILAKCKISAAFSGRVAEQRIREQEFAQPGQVLLEIIDDETPEVDFIAPSKWLAWLRIGQPLAVAIEETGRVYPAKVERIGARVDPVSQSVKVVARFAEVSPDLIAGMSGTISLSPEKKP